MGFKAFIKFSFIMILGQGVCAFGDTFVLKNGESFEGTLQSFQGGAYVVKQGEKTRTLQQSEVVQIIAAVPPVKLEDVPLPKEAPFATPMATFQAWKKAAITGSIDDMAACYVSYQQKKIRKDLKAIKKSKRKEMAEVASRTEFIPAEPIYQGDRATIEVTWRTGLQSDAQPLQFILEGTQWKIIQ